MVLFPFLTAPLYMLARRSGAANARRILLGVCVTELAILGWLTAQSNPEEPLQFLLGWLPEVGLNVSFWLDGPALFWAWLVLGIGFGVAFYAGYYMDPSDRPYAFYGNLQLFMASMLGVVVTRNVLLMYFFWELTSLTSFQLIGHWHHSKSAREGALCALTVTGLGGLVMLVGLALLYLASGELNGGVGTLEWPDLWAMRDGLVAHRWSGWILGLMMIGAMSKSAQFPFHFWLPNAMEAPTPVSAYLHAATMVKAGIYLTGRMLPIFSGHEGWIVIGLIGVITMCIGGWSAIHAIDLKQLLAHSTVSQLGLIMAYYGFGATGHGDHGNGHGLGEALLQMDLLLVLSHALFKGGLFMIIGIIDHGTGTREWTRLGGLAKYMPLTAVLTILGCASMAGVPLTLGFVAKELFIHAGLHVAVGPDWLQMLLPTLGIFASVFTVAYCLRMTVTPFFGKLRDSSIHPHKPAWGMVAVPLVMIGACGVLGLWMAPINEGLAQWINPLASRPETGFHLAFYHHPDILFAISIGLFISGTVVFLLSGVLNRLYKSIGSPTPWFTTYRVLFLGWLMNFAGVVQRTFQSYSLRRNLIVIFATTFVLVAAAMTRMPREFFSKLHAGETAIAEWLIVLITVLCLGMAIYARTNLLKLIAMTPIGLLVGTIFIIYFGPDLALTQLMVEAVLGIAFLMMLFRLPQKTTEPFKASRAAFDIPVALAVGLLAGGLCYLGASYPNNMDIAQSYLRDSKPLGGGGNVVNVILVDFRGIDTMGEITVLCLAAIGGLCMIRMGRKRDDLELDRTREDAAFAKFNFFPEGEEIVASDHGPYYSGNSLIFQTVVRIAPAAMLAFSIYLFLRGHNLPGGGFIAGLMTALAFVAFYLAYQVELGPRFWKKPMIRLLPLGLAFAMGTGAAAIANGNFPFLTSAHGHVHIPLFNSDLHLASAAVFDLGVYLVVVGSVLMLIKFLSQGRENHHGPEF